MTEMREEIAKILFESTYGNEDSWSNSSSLVKDVYLDKADKILALLASEAQKTGLELTDEEIEIASLIIVDDVKKLISKAADFAKGDQEAFKIKEIELSHDISTKQILKAQLAKVMPWHQAELDKAKKELINDIIDDLNKLVVLHNEIKPNGNIVVKAGAIHDMTVKYVKLRQSLKGNQ